MAKKKQNIPAYGTAEINGVTISVPGSLTPMKRVPIYASTCEELSKRNRTHGSRYRTPFSEAKPYRRRLL